jgi:hypothetical protein
MLAGHHPLILFRMAMAEEATFNPPSRVESGDYLTNAEFLSTRLKENDLHLADIESMGIDLFRATDGLTDVSDSALKRILTLAEQKSKKGVLRKKGLVDSSELKPIQRKVPIQKGANYGDPENKAFPLDTAERVKAAHAHLHKAWQNKGETGITASYGRDKFLKVHKRIITRMRRLGLQHTPVDTLDSATRRMLKAEKAAKVGFVNEHLLTEESDVYLLKQFSNIWDDYVNAALSMALSGDTGSENMKKDSERNLFLAKDGIVAFVVSLTSDVAEQAKLNAAFTDWATYLQQYIEMRDSDDFAASFQSLKDWQKSKSVVAGLIAKWIVNRDAFAEASVDGNEIAETDEPEVGDIPRGAPAGGTQPGATQPEVTNPPAPMANMNPNQLQDAAASPAAPVPAANTSPTTASVYPPQGVEQNREQGSGHKPYRDDCTPDRRSGKCYKKHGK